MRYLGLLGGLSWQSTVEYYRLINEGVSSRLGGLHSAPLLVHSLDFAPVNELQRADRWEDAGALLAAAAEGLEREGADGMLIASNTMHCVASIVERAIGVPLLHIVDPVGQALQAAGLRTAGLLGTRWTMELPFWRERLTERFGVELLVPGRDDRDEVHRVILEELCLGVISPSSRARYVRIMEELGARGAEGVILGCTEISLLIRAGDSALPAFDTTALHAAAAVEFISGGGPASSPLRVARGARVR